MVARRVYLQVYHIDLNECQFSGRMRLVVSSIQSTEKITWRASPKLLLNSMTSRKFLLVYYEKRQLQFQNPTSFSLEVGYATKSIHSSTMNIFLVAFFRDFSLYRAKMILVDSDEQARQLFSVRNAKTISLEPLLIFVIGTILLLN